MNIGGFFVVFFGFSARGCGYCARWLGEYTSQGFFYTSTAGAEEGVGKQARNIDHVKSLVVTVLYLAVRSS